MARTRDQNSVGECHTTGLMAGPSFCRQLGFVSFAIMHDEPES